MLTECPAGFYGHACQESCSTNCNVSGTCGKVTGQCIGGCQAGWKKSKCDTSRDTLLFIKCEEKKYVYAMVHDQISDISQRKLYFPDFNLAKCNLMKIQLSL